MRLDTRCYSCEAPIIFAEGKDICRCGACGRFNSRPKSEKQESDLMKYANERRNLGEFDKAEAAYDKVLQKNLDEHEARWGILLCRRGVIYLEDAASGEVVITCRRTASSSITTDLDFKRACEDAPLQIRRQYERDAEYIDAIQREIRSMGKGDGYDVFICYKETEPGTGERTQDSVRALNLYQTLTRRGFRVFYAPVSLKDHLGANYEAAIFHAIETAQVMLALGTNPEYFGTTWMQSEWKRFLEKVDAGERKLLIPLYQGFAPNKLPGEFSDRFLQGLDMSDVGFMFDLENMLGKVIRKEEPKVSVESEEVRRMREELEKFKQAEAERQRKEDELKAELERLRLAEERQAEEKKRAEEAARRELEAKLAEEIKRAEEKRQLEEAASRKHETELAEEKKRMERRQLAEEAVRREREEKLAEEKRRAKKLAWNTGLVDDDGAIIDSWKEIFAAIDDGSYKAKYQIGNTKLLDLGPEGKVHMQIVAFDTDERADGQGRAPITWISKELLKNERRMNPELKAKGFLTRTYSEGTGSIGGWEKCELRSVLNGEIRKRFPEEFSSRLLTVMKSQAACDVKGKIVNQTTEDVLWIPDVNEIKKNGIYGTMFDSNETCMKRLTEVSSSSASSWWLRSADDANYFNFVYGRGYDINPGAHGSYGVALGFCT